MVLMIIPPWERTACASTSHIPPPLVSIIIPVYGGDDLTNACIAAVRSSAGRVSHEVIVVDDASPTPFAANHAGVSIVRSGENGGFAAACNLGASRAAGRYLVFLNNDTEPQPGWLEPMLTILETEPSVGLVGPKLIFPDNTIQHCGKVWKDINVPECQPFHIYYRMPANAPCVSRSRDYPLLTGACLVARREQFLALGGFDPRYRNGWEDDDLCCRYRAHGLTCRYCAESTVTHHEGITRKETPTDNSRSPERRQCFLTNRALFWQNWGAGVVRDDGTFYREDGFTTDPDHCRLSPQLQQQTGAPWIGSAAAPLLNDILLDKAHRMVEAGHYAQARTMLEDLATTSTATPELLALLGQVCGYQLDHPASIAYFERARKSAPDSTEILFGLGVEYFLTSRYTHSMAAFDHLIALVPEIAMFHRYRGMCLQELGREPEAKAAFDEALRIDPEYAEAMGSLAVLLMKHCHFDHAEALMKQALAIKPDLSATVNDLGRLYMLQARIPEAVKQYRAALALEPGNLLAVCNILYSLCYLDTIPPEELFREHKEQMAAIAPPVPRASAPYSTEQFAREKRLRIGYISNDFCLHSVAYFLEPVLRCHDQKHFEVFCYSNRLLPDDTTRRMMATGCNWREIHGLPAEEVASMIERDRIGLLVDLSGHTARNRLDVCRLKPAPVMATWLGYPHSTGMAQFDYYISDPLCDPPGMTDHLYTERVWRLPRVFCTYQPPANAPPLAPPPCRQSGSITFGSFNNLAKASGSTVALWAAILQRVPGSRLFLKSASLGGGSTRRLVIERFAAYGIAPERLVLMAHTPSPEGHLELYAQVDIALDTFPYHGTTTTCEALWMGVPVVTLAGRTHVSRVGVSFLTALNLSRLVAQTPGEYLETAVSLAGSPDELVTLRRSLREMMSASPLLDAAGVTREFEEACVAMRTEAGSGERRP